MPVCFSVVGVLSFSFMGVFYFTDLEQILELELELELIS